MGLEVAKARTVPSRPRFILRAKTYNPILQRHKKIGWIHLIHDWGLVRRSGPLMASVPLSPFASCSSKHDRCGRLYDAYQGARLSVKLADDPRPEAPRPGPRRPIPHPVCHHELIPLA